MSKLIRFFVFSLLIITTPLASAKGVYLLLEDFLKEAFSDSIPVVKKYWLTDEDRQVAEKILYRKLEGLRLPYWQQGAKTAWVFDEVGKTEPITIGVVVEANQIQQLYILEFRESRGWEVKYPFFRDQFVGVHLLSDQELSKGIDGITGATLSVHAVKKVAALALYFHQQVVVEQNNEQ